MAQDFVNLRSRILHAYFSDVEYLDHLAHLLHYPTQWGLDAVRYPHPTHNSDSRHPLYHALLSILSSRINKSD